jgi:N-acyl-D-amino-acid deacylase
LLDVILKGGSVVSGAGNPWYKADIGIKDGRIARIGMIMEEGDKVINADKLFVCPGFIDIHSHSDFSLLINPLAESKIRQGVTTEVIGNCGNSAAPLNDDVKDNLRKSNSLVIEAGIDLNWITMGDYFNRLRYQGVALNVAALVGHGTIRANVMGFEKRPPRKSEMEDMKAMTKRAMEDGAFGLSSGLIYPPSCYASTNELTELSRVVTKFGGIYTSHIRGEGETLLDSVKEAITIGSEALIPVEISHHKIMGKANWGLVNESLQMIKDARDKGVDVTCDAYPYVASSFSLRAMLPPWAHQGGVDKLVNRLKNSEDHMRMERDMLNSLPDWSSPLSVADWENTIITGCRSHEEYEGRNIAEIAKESEVTPFKLTFDLLVDDPSISVVRFSMNEEDVQTVMRSPYMMVGTDGYSLAPYGVLGKGKPHPRSYGTYPRILGRYVREKHTITFEEAVRKMSSLPALKVGLKRRGLILPGMFADIILVDRKKVLDNATFSEPHQYPEGIEYVLVNGKVIIERGKHTGTLVGEVLNLQEEIQA